MRSAASACPGTWPPGSSCGRFAGCCALAGSTCSTSSTIRRCGSWAPSWPRSRLSFRRSPWSRPLPGWLARAAATSSWWPVPSCPTGRRSPRGWPGTRCRGAWPARPRSPTCAATRARSPTTRPRSTSCSRRTVPRPGPHRAGPDPTGRRTRAARSVLALLPDDEVVAGADVILAGPAPDLLARTGHRVEDVVAAAALQGVVAAQPIQRVDLVVADEDVVSVRTLDDLPAPMDVVMLPGRTVVGLLVQRHLDRLVIPVAEPVVSGLAVDVVVPGVHDRPVVVRPAGDQVVARPAEDDVVAEAAVHLVVARAAVQLVEAAAAHQP